MELFIENTRTFSTRANAIRFAKKALDRYPEARYVIAANESARFFPVFIGNETIDLVHAGYCVAN
jgi:hypothetical protein